MSRSLGRLAAVQAISICRLLGAVAFSAIAFQKFPLALVCGVYVVAAVSDLLDGFVARRLAVTSFAGGILDLVSDKSLTVVSLLYAAASGVAIFPLAVIGTRELISLGLRAVKVGGRPLWPTNRWFGGAMATALWGNTFLLILSEPDTTVTSITAGIYWAYAAVSLLNLAWRLFTIRRGIMRALVEGSGSD
jgi:CDP-diacylglycerol--glycerol-3-phosphate 3-phosphatidyltransferase